MKSCSRCGRGFYARSTGGRPRSKCDDCRTNHDKIDGTTWRNLRRQVLREQPWCAVNGCGRPSTEVDHIVPLARGGAPLERWNLQGMCKHHNASKGARTGILLRDPDTPPLRVFDDGPADSRPPALRFFDDDKPRRSWVL